MKKSLQLFLLVLLLTPTFLFGQKKNGFQIDTAKILSNKNLDSFITKLKSDSFQIDSNQNAIPSFIKKGLKKLNHGFSIANPEQAYRCCCMSPKRLPERQLKFLLVSNNVVALTYLKGGRGLSTHLLLIKFDNKKIIDLWWGYYWGNAVSAKEVAAYLENNKEKTGDLSTNTLNL